MKKVLLLTIILIIILLVKETVSSVEVIPTLEKIETRPLTKDLPVISTPSIEEPTPELKPPKINKLGKKELQVYNSRYTIPDELSIPIYDIIKKYSNLNIGIYAISLKDYTCIGYNESYSIDTASSIKAPYCLYVMKEISKGNHSLKDTMVYTERYYIGGSGEIQYSPFGTIYTIEELLFKCIDCSDNIAYIMLQDYFGYEGYNQMIEPLGCTIWLNGYVKWGKYTAEELAIIWNEIYEFSQNSIEGKYLLNLLLNAKFNFIKDTMKRYSKVAHKSGFNPNSYNDAAIIFSDSDFTTNLKPANDYILVIMTSPGNRGNNEQCLAEISKQMDLIMRNLALFQNRKSGSVK